LYPGHWSEQTGVQAAGTNDNTTFFIPRYWLKATFSPETDGREKSGAGSPILTFNSLSMGFSSPGLKMLSLKAADAPNADGTSINIIKLTQMNPAIDAFMDYTSHVDV
jgi:hypothetical protein